MRPAPWPSLEHRGVFGTAESPLSPPTSSFEALGGRDAVSRLVDGLYDRIERDPLLRPAFARDLTHERTKQKRFFEAWLGGDPGYFDDAWYPGVRAAHASISISRGMAERWLEHFLGSLADLGADEGAARGIEPSVRRMALVLVNRSGEPEPREHLRCRGTGAEAQPFIQAVLREDVAALAAADAFTPAFIATHGRGLLLLAATRGKAVATRELLLRGVDPNLPSTLPGSERTSQKLPDLLITPLCAALAKRRHSVSELLVQHGARYDIFSAACLGDIDAVRELLDHAPELANARDPASDVAPYTPLVHAVLAGQRTVAALLLERGAVVGPNSVRLIAAAADNGDEALVDLLLEHGADVASMGVGTWVLYRRIADKLLSGGANVNRPPGAWIWRTCTGNSGHRENLELVSAMLRCGADVQALYAGRTALFYAKRAGFSRVVALLQENGAKS